MQKIRFGFTLLLVVALAGWITSSPAHAGDLLKLKGSGEPTVHAVSRGPHPSPGGDQRLAQFRQQRIPAGNPMGLGDSNDPNVRQKRWLMLCLFYGSDALHVRDANFLTWWQTNYSGTITEKLLEDTLLWWDKFERGDGTTSPGNVYGKYHLIGAAFNSIRPQLPALSKGDSRDISPWCKICTEDMGSCYYCLGSACSHCH